MADIRPILELIKKHEVGDAARAQGVDSPYDVVYGGIAAKDRPKKLTAMTIGEVLDWQAMAGRTYGSSAAGAYQIIRKTLVDFAPGDSVKFSPQTQDAIAEDLLERRGWSECVLGQISPEQFADNLSREWASFPVQRDQKGASGFVKRGQSYYAGDGLNRAHADPEEVLTAVKQALGNGEEKSIMGPYRKAIAAALTGVVAVVALFVPSINETVTPEVIGSVAAVLGTLLVYFIPNESA